MNRNSVFSTAAVLAMAGMVLSSSAEANRNFSKWKVSSPQKSQQSQETYRSVYGDSSASATAASGSSTAASSSERSLGEQLKLQYRLDYLGGALSERDSNERLTDVARRPSPAGMADGEPVYTAHTFVTGYRIDKSRSMDLLVGFTYTSPTAKFVKSNGKVANIDPTQRGYTFGDPAIRYSAGTLVSEGDFSMGGDFRYYIPVSTSSQAKRHIGALRVSLAPNYQINDELSFGASGYFRFYFYAQNNDGTDLRTGKPTSLRGFLSEWSIGPSYKLSDTLSASLGWNMLALKNIDETPKYFELADTSTDLGISWDPIKQLSFTPYLNFATGYRVAADTTTFNLVAILKAF